PRVRMPIARSRFTRTVNDTRAGPPVGGMDGRPCHGSPGSIVGADYLPVAFAPQELERFVINRLRQEVDGPVHEREIGPARVAGTEAPGDVVVLHGVGRPRPGRAAPAGVRF